MFGSKLDAWAFCVMVWGAVMFGNMLVFGIKPETAFLVWAAMVSGAAGALVAVGETQ